MSVVCQPQDRVPPPGHVFVVVTDGADGISLHAQTANVVGNIESARVGGFLRGVGGHRVVCFDATHLHWTMMERLCHQGDADAISTLWALSRDGKLLDVQELDRLVRLAGDGFLPAKRSLADLATSYANGVNGSDVDTTGLLSAVYDGLCVQVEEIVRRLGIPSSITDRFGPLGLTIEIQAAIARETPRRHGVRIDQELLHRAIEWCTTRRDALLQRLRQDSQFRGCLRPSPGSPEFDRNGFPRLDEVRLRQWLTTSVDAIRGLHNVPIPTTLLNGEVSMWRVDWDKISPFCSGVGKWRDMESICAIRKRLVRLGERAETIGGEGGRVLVVESNLNL